MHRKTCSTDGFRANCDSLIIIACANWILEAFPDTPWDCHRTADQARGGAWCQGGQVWGRQSVLAVPWSVCVRDFRTHQFRAGLIPGTRLGCGPTSLRVPVTNRPGRTGIVVDALPSDRTGAAPRARCPQQLGSTLTAFGEGRRGGHGVRQTVQHQARGGESWTRTHGYS